LVTDEQVVDPRTYLAPAREAVSEEVTRVLTVLAAAPAGVDVEPEEWT
jgi:hypothetical protein